MAQVTVVGVAGLVGSAILVPQIGSVEAFLKNGPLAQLLMLSVIATFGLPAGLYMGLIASRRVTYFHQRGLRQTGLGQPKVIPYDQVESVAFKSTRVFVNGIYSITRQKLRLRLADGRTKRLRHACKEVLRPAAGDGPPVELQKGAMAIAAALAERMRGELDAGRMVHWTKDLDLYPDGLQLHSTGRRFPWRGIAKIDVHEGVFRMRLVGQGKPVRLRTAADNFWPGYLLVRDRLLALEQTRARTVEVPARPVQASTAGAPAAAGQQSPGTPTMPAGTAPGLHVHFTSQVGDLAALHRWRRWQGRSRRWAAILVPPVAVVAVVLLLMALAHSRGGLVAPVGAPLIATFLLALALVGGGAIVWRWRDNYRLQRELAATARETSGPDSPFGPSEFHAGAAGYEVRTPQAVIRRPWANVAMVELFEGHILVVTAGGRADSPVVEVIIPDRAFGRPDGPARAHRMLAQWHLAAVSCEIPRRGQAGA
ncbi:MAG: hypothetical protein WBF17_27090 [Phycisphaerae bacterium]